MILSEALKKHSTVSANVNGCVITIERSLGGWLQYDVQPQEGERCHNWVSESTDDVLEEIYTSDDTPVFSDDSLEAADWQRAAPIDISDCACKGCQKFLAEFT